MAVLGGKMPVLTEFTGKITALGADTESAATGQKVV